MKRIISYIIILFLTIIMGISSLNSLDLISGKKNQAYDFNYHQQTESKEGFYLLKPLENIILADLNS